MPKRQTSVRLAASKRSPSRDFELRKYMELSAQQDTLHRKLSLSFSSPTLSPTPDGSYPSSPTTSMGMSILSPSNYHNNISNHLSQSQPTQTEPMPTATAFDHEDKERLAEVAQQIKATLTELLNHESVKSDDKFRHWVQDRLIDAEMELKSQRRQNRRTSSVERDQVNHIAESFKNQGSGRFATTL